MEEDIVIIGILIAVFAFAAWLFWRQQRREALISKYGPEYERLVREKGDAKKAERELEEREARVRDFRLRALDPGERDRYWSECQRVQALFVDHPQDAVEEAHRLLMVVMRERGYPDATLEQRGRDLSVHYPDLVSSYREAAAISDASRASGNTSTEDLRQATIHYRSLFAALLDEGDKGRRRPKYEAAS
ncbi:MAG: hypothetical protein ACRD21_17785 [Vicinamibacteria bacterium]